MSIDQLRYEIRIVGRWVFAVPLCIIAGSALLAEFLYLIHIEMIRIQQLLTASLEMLLPVAVAILVANTASYDKAIELQLAVESKFAYRVALRSGLICIWSGCIAIGACACIYHLKLLLLPGQIQSWQVIPQVLAEQLTWLAPELWLSAAGLCLALIMRSPTGSNALLAGIWMLNALFYGYFVYTPWLHAFFLFPTTLAPLVDFWLSNRLELLAVALLLSVIAGFLLQNTEALLQGRAGEE